MTRHLLAVLLLLLPGAMEASESLVMVTPRSPWTLRELEATGIDLVSYDPETGEVYLTVSRDEEQQLLDAGFDVTTVRWDLESDWQLLQETPDLGLYHPDDPPQCGLDTQGL